MREKSREVLFLFPVERQRSLSEFQERSGALRWLEIQPRPRTWCAGPLPSLYDIPAIDHCRSPLLLAKRSIGVDLILTRNPQRQPSVWPRRNAKGWLRASTIPQVGQNN